MQIDTYYYKHPADVIEEGDIAYKVVEKKTRWCATWASYKNRFDTSTLKTIAKRIRKKYPELFPRYFKNSIVLKAPNTPGILVFKREKNAVEFSKSHIFKVGHMRTIKVRCLCSGYPIKNLIDLSWRFPKYFVESYKFPNADVCYSTPPDGTFGVDAIEVLE